MSEQLTLDIPRPTESVVPACHRCGAHGDPIETSPGLDFGGAALFAVVAIRQHDRVCTGGDR